MKIPTLHLIRLSVSAKVLRISADIIAPSLTYIFNLSLYTGIYIDEWKRARVIPIYKYEDRRKCENYRPISILPIVSKVFEREVFRQLYAYLSNNSLLSKFQSGFQPKHSTLSALIQMCDDLLKNIDNGEINCVVFLDVRKAFDSINHESLKDKLQKFQNRAARVITGATYDIRSSDILENLNWKPLEERRNHLKSTFIYKILNGHTAPKLKEAFRFNNERDIAYYLRSRETDLALPLPKKEFGKRRFCYNGALHWNNLPYEAKSAESLSSFKTILRQRMS